MHRLVPLLLVAAVSPARADGFYFTESFGGTHVKDELGAYMSGAFRVQVGVGVRRQNLAFELWAGGDMNMATQDTYSSSSDPPMDLFEYGLNLKYLQPLSHHLEIYLRGTASAGEMEGGTIDGYSGRGLGMGAGIQLKGKVSAWGLLFWPLFFVDLKPKITGAIFLDDGYDFYRLHGDRPVAVDAQLTHVTFGYAVGTDF